MWGIDELIANVFSWMVCVSFQFFTNRVWVFHGETNGAIKFIKQMAVFFMGRLFTLAVEEIILAVFITWLKLDSLAVKLIAQIVVIVLNYVISKMVVFQR